MTTTAPAPARYCPRCSLETELELCPADGTPTFLRALQGAERETLTEGDVISGRYRIQGILGQGGFGAVFAAEHVMTGQAAAVKVMIGDAAGVEQDLVQRFLQEARITASLSHPNTVRIYDFGQTDSGILFMAMEQLRGPTLDARLKQAAADGGALSELEAATIGVQVLRSLTEAHAAGLVHRDLKPGNLILVQMIGEPPMVKVLDFGIARMQGSALTQAGTALGTPTYMSPEQGRGEVPDGRSDLYALGCILHTCVSGRPPFVENTPMAVLLAHQLKPMPAVRESAKVPLSDAFVAVIERATQKKAADRYPDAVAMREALEAAMALPRPKSADPVWAPTLEADVLVPDAARTGAGPSIQAPTLEAAAPVLATSRPHQVGKPAPATQQTRIRSAAPTAAPDAEVGPTLRRSAPNVPHSDEDRSEAVATVEADVISDSQLAASPPRTPVGRPRSARNARRSPRARVDTGQHPAAPGTARRKPTTTGLRRKAGPPTPRPGLQAYQPPVATPVHRPSGGHVSQPLHAMPTPPPAPAAIVDPDATPAPIHPVAARVRTGPTRSGRVIALVIAAVFIGGGALWLLARSPRSAVDPAVVEAAAGTPPAESAPPSTRVNAMESADLSAETAVAKEATPPVAKVSAVPATVVHQPIVKPADAPNPVGTPSTQAPAPPPATNAGIVAKPVETNAAPPPARKPTAAKTASTPAVKPTATKPAAKPPVKKPAANPAAAKPAAKPAAAKPAVKKPAAKPPVRKPVALDPKKAFDRL